MYDLVSSPNDESLKNVSITFNLDLHDFQITFCCNLEIVTLWHILSLNTKKLGLVIIVPPVISNIYNWEAAFAIGNSKFNPEFINI